MSNQVNSSEQFENLNTIINLPLSRKFKVMDNSNLFMKYGIHVEDTKNRNLLISSLTLKEIKGIEYSINIDIGTPFQNNISVLVDTGSSAIVILYVLS